MYIVRSFISLISLTSSCIVLSEQLGRSGQGGTCIYMIYIVTVICSLWSSLHLNPGIAVNIAFLQTCVLWYVIELFLFTWRLDHLVLYFDRHTDYCLVCLLCDIEIALKIKKLDKLQHFGADIFVPQHMYRVYTDPFFKVLETTWILVFTNCYVCCSNEMSMHISLLWTFDVDRRPF